jgi:hypothetical protein
MSQQLQQQQQQQTTTDDYPRLLSCDTCPNTKETWLKAFLIDDSINQNFWHIPDNALKRYVDGFKGRPLILHPSGDHPDYIAEGVKEASPTFVQDILRHQEQYKIGDIVDVQYESFKENPDRKAYFAYIRLTNPEYLDKVKQGASSMYVSPQIFDLDQRPPGQPTTNFLPLHLAIVREPAYGNIAKVRASCNGESSGCINALKKAASQENSYFVNSSANSQTYNNLSAQQQLDPNYPGLTNLAKILEQAGIDLNQAFTYNQSGGFQPVTQSKTTKTRKVDAQGNLITETQDLRPGKQQFQQEQTPNQSQDNLQTSNLSNPNSVLNQQNQQSTVGQNPQTPRTTDPNTPSPQLQPQTTLTSALPEDVQQRLKRLDALENEFEEFKKFKQTQEEKQILAASEQQRQTIDQALTPIFPDDGERQQVTDFFVSLNINDQQLQQLLEFITTGVLNTDKAAAANKPQQQQPPATGGNNRQPPVKGADVENVIPVVAHTRRRVKGASLIMGNTPTLEYDEYGNKTSSTFSKGILGDIDWEKLL